MFDVVYLERWCPDIVNDNLLFYGYHKNDIINSGKKNHILKTRISAAIFRDTKGVLVCLSGPLVPDKNIPEFVYKNFKPINRKFYGIPECYRDLCAVWQRYLKCDRSENFNWDALYKPPELNLNVDFSDSESEINERVEGNIKKIRKVYFKYRRMYKKALEKISCKKVLDQEQQNNISSPRQKLNDFFFNANSQKLTNGNLSKDDRSNSECFLFEDILFDRNNLNINNVDLLKSPLFNQLKTAKDTENCINHEADQKTSSGSSFKLQVNDTPSNISSSNNPLKKQDQQQPSNKITETELPKATDKNNHKQDNNSTYAVEDNCELDHDNGTFDTESPTIIPVWKEKNFFDQEEFDSTTTEVIPKKLHTCPKNVYIDGDLSITSVSSWGTMKDRKRKSIDQNDKTNGPENNVKKKNTSTKATKKKSPEKSAVKKNSAKKIKENNSEKITKENTIDKNQSGNVNPTTKPKSRELQRILLKESPYNQTLNSTTDGFSTSMRGRTIRPSTAFWSVPLSTAININNSTLQDSRVFGKNIQANSTLVKNNTSKTNIKQSKRQRQVAPQNNVQDEELEQKLNTTNKEIAIDVDNNGSDFDYSLNEISTVKKQPGRQMRSSGKRTTNNQKSPNLNINISKENKNITTNISTKSEDERLSNKQSSAVKKQTEKYTNKSSVKKSKENQIQPPNIPDENINADKQNKSVSKSKNLNRTPQTTEPKNNNINTGVRTQIITRSKTKENNSKIINKSLENENTSTSSDVKGKRKLDFENANLNENRISFSANCNSNSQFTKPENLNVKATALKTKVKQKLDNRKKRNNSLPEVLNQLMGRCKKIKRIRCTEPIQVTPREEPNTSSSANKTAKKQTKIVTTNPDEVIGEQVIFNTRRLKITFDDAQSVADTDFISDISFFK